jgi:hypothetical protein
MSHDRGGHDSCLRRILIPLLHIASLSVARGVTDVVVGSGALLARSSSRLHELEMRGDHLEVIRQQIARPTPAVHFSEMVRALATLPTPQLLWDIAEPHWVDFCDPDDASHPALQIENVDEVADLHAAIVELIRSGIVLVGLADRRGLVAGHDLEHQAVIVFVRAPKLSPLSPGRFHLANVKGEPRPQRAWLVPDSELRSEASFRKRTRKHET